MTTLGGLELLISKELEDDEFKQGLDDIHNFRLGVIRNLSKTDLEQIQVAGFRFRTKTLAGRREEIKQFILEHPSLMSQDVESIKYKFKLLGRILKKKEGAKAPRVEEEDEFEEEEEPKKKPKKATKPLTMKKPKKILASSSEDTEEDL